VLPLVCALVLVVLQAGLVVRDQVLLVHAVREAARAAALDPAGAPPAPAGLHGDRLGLEVGRSGTMVTVRGTYRSPVFVPLLRRGRPDVELAAAVTMRVEYGESGS
jgi:hypothetical protein